MEETNNNEIVKGMKSAAEQLHLQFGLDNVLILASSETECGELETSFRSGYGSVFAKIGLARDFLTEQDELKRNEVRKNYG